MSSTTATATGTARFVGTGIGVVHEGDRVVEWFGDARLFQLDPPLRGYSVVVASTLPDGRRLTARGNGVEVGVETLMFGVTQEDLQIDPEWTDLPGGGWGSTPEEALAEAGYRFV